MIFVIIDDNPHDRELIIRELRKQWPDATFREVFQQKQWQKLLQKGEFDVVVTDFQFHWSNGMKILASVRSQYPEKPVIMLTDTGSEVIAVEGMKAGLSDYVLKNHLKRLPVAVKESIEKAALQRYVDKSIQQLRVSEEKFRQFAENLHDVLWMVDKSKRRVLYLNPAVERIVGLPAAVFYEQPERFKDLVHPEDLPRFIEAFQAFTDRLEVEFRVCPPDGGVRWVRMRGYAVKDDSGTLDRYLGITEDFTEKKQFELELEKRDAHLNLALEAANAATWELDLNRRINTWTEQTARLFGLEPQNLQVDFETFMNIVWPDDRPVIERVMEDIQNRNFFEAEFRIRRGDGALRWVISRGRTLRDEHGKVTRLIGVTVDITERKNLEAQLLQSRKLEAIGRLAGGIAHDFNNLLSAIIGYTDMALEDLPQEHPIRYHLDQVLIASLRAKELVQQILTFSRRSTEEMGLVQLAEVVEEALVLMQAGLPDHIRLHAQIARDVGAVMGNASQLHQVVLNLCTNSMYALKDTGGDLRVVLEKVHLDPSTLQELGFRLEPGPYARLMVEDTGPGMDQQTLERIFEPFFTTKPVGEGTGLGLSMVHGIVQSHGGEILVQSEPGQGCRFVVYFPLAAGEVAKAPERKPIPRGTERIALVDDMEQIVEMAMRLLQRWGYRVEGYARSRVLLERLQADPYSVDLVLADVSMPDMSGLELAKAIRKLRPNLPVVLMSGFSETDILKEEGSTPIHHFIMKPLIPDQLARTIRTVLDEHKEKGEARGKSSGH